MKKCIFCMATCLLLLCCVFTQHEISSSKEINNQTAMLSTTSLVTQEVVESKFNISDKTENFFKKS